MEVEEEIGGHSTLVGQGSDQVGQLLKVIQNLNLGIDPKVNTMPRVGPNPVFVFHTDHGDRGWAERQGSCQEDGTGPSQANWTWAHAHCNFARDKDWSDSSNGEGVFRPNTHGEEAREAFKRSHD